jgi:nicotinamidase/pyrazinamidase
MDQYSALVIVDIQNDFLPGGALAVPGGDKIIPVLNEYISVFKDHHSPIIATRDWHPQITKHFKQYGGLWPPHCIQNTWGARFHPDLHLPSDTIIISAGIGEDQEGYSGFEGVDHTGKPFLNVLKEKQISHLYIGGIATEYCVKSTVLQAIKFGFKVNLLTDAIIGINLQPSDSQKAIDEMVNHGANLTTLDTIKQNPHHKL